MKLSPGDYLVMGVGPHDGRPIERLAHNAIDAVAHYLAVARICGPGSGVQIIETGGRPVTRHLLAARADRERAAISAPQERAASEG